MRTSLLTLREVARYLRAHPGTVYRLVKSGQLRGVRVGRDFRFGIEVLEEFVVKGGSINADSEGQK